MRARCPNCGRGFNCDGGSECWCLKTERNFDYEEMILRSGAMGCVCPVCLTGRTDLADVESVGPTERPAGPAPGRRGGRRRRENKSNSQP